MAKAKRPSSTKRIRKEVKLDPVTPEFAEAAVAMIESLCEEYGITPQDKDALWGLYATFCTHLLLKNGELPGPD